MGIEIAIGSLIGAIIATGGASAMGASTGVAIGIGAATLAAGGAIAAGVASRQSSRNQASQIGLQMAAEEAQAANESLERERQLRRTLATQNAMFGAAGIDLGSGTPSVIAGESLAEARRQDRQGVIFSQARTGILGAQRQDTLRAGNAALGTGIINAGASLLNAGYGMSQRGRVPGSTGGGPATPIPPFVPPNGRM